MELEKRLCFTIIFTSYLLSSLCLTTSMAKRFDVNGGFGHADEFDDDIPQLIEINKEDFIEVNKKPSTLKPKPNFTPPLLPQLPKPFGLSSSWNFGTSLLGELYYPSIQALRPPSPSLSSSNGPYQSVTYSDELLLTPATTVTSQVQNVRPPSTILADSLAESTHEQAEWTTQALSQPPLFLQQQLPSSLPGPSSQLWTTQSQQYFPSQPASLSSQSQPFPSLPVVPQTLLNSQLPSSQHQPTMSSPQILYQSSQPHQFSNPSKPFSLYEQLYLNLLESEAWEKIQDQKNQSNQQSQQNVNLKPQQSQGQQFEQTNFVLPVNLMPSYLAIPTMTNLTGSNNFNLNNNTNSSNAFSTILNPIADGTVDYTYPGQSLLPQYTNSDILVDDDKFFDKEDDFVEVDGDEDEFMEMVE